MGALEISPFTARLEAALVRRLSALFVAERGPLPLPHAWLSLGGSARWEQPLPGDQDHALVLAPGVNERERRSYLALGRQVAEDLVAAGYPRCPGGLGAERLCLGLREWCEKIREAGEDPGPQAALQVAVWLDGRRIAGELSLRPLREALAKAALQRGLQAEMGRAALSFRVPAEPLLPRLSRRELDLKREGLSPLVLSARCLGVLARSAERSTLGRLLAARGAGLLGADLAEEAGQAFRLLLDLRMKGALEGPSREAKLTPRSLPPGERHGLAIALKAARRLQERTAERLGLW